MHLKLHFRRFVRYVNIGGPKKTGKTIYYYFARGFERNYISDATILIANLMRRKLLLRRSLHCICETVTKKRERNKVFSLHSFVFHNALFPIRNVRRSIIGMFLRAPAARASVPMQFIFDDELPRDYLDVKGKKSSNFWKVGEGQV